MPPLTVNEIWTPKTDKNRYEAVLEFELANPLASDLTKNFLKNKKCVKWIMESRITTIKHPIKPRHLLKSAIEAYILYKDRKSSGNFKFPAKLHPLIATTPSGIIQETLSKILDPENSEYLSLKKAKKRVENASGMKILVELTSNQKAIQMKDSEDVEDSEDEEDVDIERLLKYSRKISREIDEKRKIEMDEILEKADPEKIWLKMSENSENLEMNEDMMKKKTSLKKIAKKQKKNVRNRSKKLVEASDDSDQDGVICLEDTSEDVKNKDPAKSKNKKRKDPEEFPEDISNSESKKSEKRKRRSTKDVTDSESKFTKTKKKKKTSDDVPTSEDLTGRRGGF
ncbi:Protein CBG23991 [Caenorhabditis briggsae]|uniref:Protein CBG23991 n=1 Tax=Caenorhabditis briggsae TaxID=6238 RepID=A8WJR2_CAEBR|nr:Protein CBG23991 [Caenorhabditis briggsae]CAP20705.2 Protein CBG23991 [Caenorhabditis briggsae]